MKLRVFAWAGMAVIFAGAGEFEFPAFVKEAGAAMTGRTLYRQTQSCYAGGLLQCDAYFPPVPMHQRLVIESASVTVETGTILNSVKFYGNDIRDVSLALKNISGHGNKLYAGNQALTERFEAGEQPNFAVNIEPGLNVFSSASMTLNGYLVDY